MEETIKFCCENCFNEKFKLKYEDSELKIVCINCLNSVKSPNDLAKKKNNEITLSDGIIKPLEKCKPKRTNVYFLLTLLIGFFLLGLILGRI